MFYLKAEGIDSEQRASWPLEFGQNLTLGRGQQCDLIVPWDTEISRTHAVVQAIDNNGGKLPAGPHLRVQKHDLARNGIFVDGESSDSAELRVGQRFVIGMTTFRMTDESPAAPHPEENVEEVTFSQAEIRATEFVDADRRIEVLSRLPAVILDSNEDRESYRRLVELLIAGIPRSDAVAVIEATVSEETGPEPTHSNLRSDSKRSQEDFRIIEEQHRRDTDRSLAPSQRLLESCFHKWQPIAHVWRTQDGQSADYTISAEVDWAFCLPLLDDQRSRSVLYVVGRTMAPWGEPLRGQSDLRPDIRFAELVADIHRSIRRLSRLERQSVGLRQFLPGPLLEAVGEDFDPAVLEPSECDVTVLFCDLRGFSRRAERESDRLPELLQQVSHALGIMTDAIVSNGGVTSDFLGDSALGFWGWPFRDPTSPVKACRAAMAIRKAFASGEIRGSDGAPFRVGIGIAHGRAVAGKIGTKEQSKITVFGPVVNLASRLEGLTKLTRVPVLIDEATAKVLRDASEADEMRLRRLATVIPYGTETPVELTELLPEVGNTGYLTDAELKVFESAVDAFTAGQWEDAYRLLHQLPADDLAQDFLSQQIVAAGRRAPADWDGVIRAPEK
ncbi:adenylate/guanylate cyclase domain-containing protein [Stratiformator vulcanicus]|uniref:Adenylate cyclase 2 n=1 Tax=Stratiformator vulcanicus TaxID=2527980 RepID=A0A517R2D5_9PLAN|nr:adenylate/guanylate cyclase domain-containing protein [Stratiformator vulcanicus]QDT38046.1 Adenylate cyclase 2 [Stratiformator vulcanicus]